MGVTTEEARAKLSLDTSDLGRGGREIEGFADKSNRSFIHAGSEARTFHRTLDKISQASPILGEALRFAINPIIGLLIGLTSGFNYLKGKIDEWNKAMDAQAARNALAIVGADKLRDIRQKQFEIEQNYQKFLKTGAALDVDTKRKDLLEGQLAAIQAMLALDKERIRLAKEAGTAKIHGEVESGKLTKPQGESALSKLNLGLGLADRQADEAALRRELDLFKKSQAEATQKRLAAQDEAARRSRELAGFERATENRLPSHLEAEVQRRTGKRREFISGPMGGPGFWADVDATETDAELEERRKMQKARLDRADADFRQQREQERKQLQDALSAAEAESAKYGGEETGAAGKWDEAMRRLNLGRAKAALSRPGPKRPQPIIDPKTGRPYIDPATGGIPYRPLGVPLDSKGNPILDPRTGGIPLRPIKAPVFNEPEPNPLNDTLGKNGAIPVEIVNIREQ